MAEIAEAAGCDASGASRIRANERPCTLNAWLRVMDLLGYKLVSKKKLCMPEDEAFKCSRIACNAPRFAP